MYCSNCGNDLKNSDAFCPHCGNKVYYDLPDPVRNTVSEDAKKIRRSLVIIFGILCSFAFVFGAILIYRAFYDNYTDRLTVISQSQNEMNIPTNDPKESEGQTQEEPISTPELSLEPPTATNGEKIRIGTILPTSGPISYFGEQELNGIEMAIEEINENGGILGKQIELIVADDEADPEKTLTAFQKMVMEDNIVGLIGALTSKCSLAIAREAQFTNTIMLSPSSTNDIVTSAGDCIFRACYTDSFQGKAIARFAFENLNASKAAILYDADNEYSSALRDVFKKSFEELGGTIVSDEKYATGDTDFSRQISRIRKTHPDIIFLPDYYPTVALIAKQLRAAGITVPMVGSDAWDEIVNNAGDEIVGCYYSNHFSPDADEPQVREFVKNYEERFGETPGIVAALGYDAAYLFAEAVERAQSIDPEKIKLALMETNSRYVTGQISFDENRDPVKSVVMVEIVPGSTSGKPQIAYVSTVDPDRNFQNNDEGIIAAAGGHF